MDPLERLLIERECERLIHAYCHVIDHGDASRVGDMFADDGVWKSLETVHDGRAAITAAFNSRQANASRMSRHVCSTILVDVIDADNARALTYVTLYRHDGKPGRRISPLDRLPEIVGDYRDTFVRTPAGWRFRTREVVTAFLQRQEPANGG